MHISERDDGYVHQRVQAHVERVYGVFDRSLIYKLR
jgi:hypothetical protein